MSCNSSYFNCNTSLTDVCCDGTPGIIVQSYLGNPSDSKSQLLSSVNLDLCSKLQFWSQGTMSIGVEAGSAKVGLETNNILVGSSGFTGVSPEPLNPHRPLLGYNETTGIASIWNPNIQSWVVISENGTTGSQGVAGSIGPQGGTGSTGSQGNNGTTGLTGPQGTTCGPGPQGWTGMQGVPGQTGSQGWTGMQGVTGQTGPQGYTGQQGVTGQTGPQGANGQQGIIGPTGSQGSTGATGSIGTTPIGTLVNATKPPDSNYMMAQGQTLSQSTYSTLFNKVGITPSFTPSTKTVLPWQAYDMAYNGSIYVVVANNDWIYISTDGINWNLAPPIGGGFFPATPTAISYCSGLGIFVIVNNTTIAYTSTDGINWIPSLIASDANVSYVACSPTTIVVGGSSDTDNSIENVWTSTDGVNWTKTPIAGTGVTITALYYSSGFGTGTAQFLLGTSSGAIQTSPTGSTWTARTSNIANQINQIVLGNLGTAGTIVAVGNGGVITTSLDNGVTWTAHTYQTGANLNGIAYNSSLFVASGSNIILTSADGQTWTTSTSTISGKSSITYGSTYVEAGANAMLTTSSNLNVWTGQTSAFPLITMNAAAFGNSAYVVGGNSGDIQSSANATTWNSRTSNYGANNIAHIIYAAGTINLFVACGSNTTQVVTSPDGTTWTAQTSNIGAVATTALAFNGTTLVLVGASGKIATSTNGTAWTSRTSNTTTSLNGVAWNGTIFCAVGNSGVIVTSPDGITWTKQSPTGLLNTSTDSWITSDGTSFYMHQGGNVVFVSTNGITWTGYAAPFTLLGLNWINGQLIAYSANNDIAYSANGQQWTLSTGGRGVTSWTKAYYYNSTLFLNTTGNGTIFTSTDGLSFVGQYTVDMISIAYSASQTKLITVGVNGLIMSSTDSGSTWTQNTSMAGSSIVTFNTIAYSSSLNLFIALTSNGGIYSSPNGTTWTQRTYSNQFMSLGFGFNNIIWEPVNGIFIAVGSLGIIVTSPDGITWTNRNTNCFSNFVQVCYNTFLGLFVTVSGSASTSILTSPNGITWSIIPSANIGGGAFQSTFSSIASLETNGFVAITQGNIMYRSTDGITWIQAYNSGNFKQAGGGYAKLFTSNVDSGAFFTQGQNAYTNSQAFIVTDGFTANVVTSIYFASNGFITNCITYDSVNDVYIIVGNYTFVYRLTRTYNKATQFVLPVLYKTAIKVL